MGHFQVGGRFENLLSFFKMAGPPSQVIDDQPRHKFYFFFMNTRFNDNKTLENSDVLSSRIAQHSHENNYIDCKTARIFALVANEIACTLRAKGLERGANVEWVLTHPV